MRSRRIFLRHSSLLAAGAFASRSLLAKSNPQAMTIQQVIDLIIAAIPGAPFKQTVDTIKAGDVNREVSGIVTTMFATVDVIRQAAALGANFIIAHEPTFYNHTDDTGWLADDEVFRYKMDLLNKHKIVVWRNHDYIHSHKPDGVVTGVLQALDWIPYQHAVNPWLINIPPASLQSVINHCKSRLHISRVQYIGDMSDQCKRVVMIPGAAGGRVHITAIQKEKPDLFICGEINEWETSEYIRDLRDSGSTTSLLILGHSLSEEPGSEWLMKWLQLKLPSVKITHVPSGDALRFA
jgi:putative NIF3 family GTP cyclohydrolase 1 type 2